MTGMPTLKPGERESKRAGSDSFDKALEKKLGREEAKTEPKIPDPKDRKILDPERKASRSESDRPKGPPDKEDVKEKKGDGREQAIQKFMDSLESELGIPSARLAEAIANLDDQQKNLPPEETVDAVLAQLELPESEEDRARAMYAAMLVEVNKPATPVMASLMPALGAEKLRSSQALEKRDAMNAGVDRLNQNFWQGAKAQAPIPPAASPVEGPMSDASSMAKAGDGEFASLMNTPPSAGKIELPPHMRGQLEGAATPAMLAALAAQQKAQATAANAESEASVEGAEVEGETEGSVAGASKNFENPATKSEASLAAGLGALAGSMMKEDSSSDSQGQQFSQGHSQGDFAKNMSSSKDAKASDKPTLDKSDFKQSLTGLEGATQATPQKLESLHVGAAAVAGANMNAPATQAENDANVRQIMNQAQYLIKRGGGEVKVEMTPEGMGPVQMKIMVQDGRVNVQMHAETDEAKKTIESGLAELKTSLAAHKLSVDHIKVDVANAVSTDTATNNQQQPNMNGNAQRDSTRQFWNNFNDNFGSSSQQRESFSDVASLKGYTQKRDPLQPITTSSRAVAGRGSGVNIVA